MLVVRFENMYDHLYIMYDIEIENIDRAASRKLYTIFTRTP